MAKHGKTKNKKRIFSGIQPSGNIHIGNYLGAIRHWVGLQTEFDNIYCVVDLHAITIPQDPIMLKAKIHEVAGLLIAAGIDPEKSTVFIQSHISAHAELAWILNCFIPVGWMNRMTQFKEKSQSRRTRVSVGLFAYPALMAADILLYETDFVPVGEDQKQHLEITREVAQRFNAIYGKVLKLPEPLIPKVGARIMGLDDATKKMSKSEIGRDHAINVLDSPDDIRSKIMKAKTDSLREIRFDESRSEIHNLLVIYELFSNAKREEMQARFEGKGYAYFKTQLSEMIIEGLRPLQSRYHRLREDPTYLDTVLSRGATRIRPIAESVLSNIKKIIGLG